MRRLFSFALLLSLLGGIPLHQARAISFLSWDTFLAQERARAKAAGFLSFEKMEKKEAPVADASTSAMLDKIACNREWLSDAWLSFNSGKQVWEAKWSKPPLFHYGLILLPELKKNMSQGDTLSFASCGVPATLSKTREGDLVLAKPGEASSPLRADTLRNLLRNKISAGNMTLFLDKTGNLILQARGTKALQLAQNSRLL